MQYVGGYYCGSGKYKQMESMKTMTKCLKSLSVGFETENNKTELSIYLISQ